MQPDASTSSARTHGLTLGMVVPLLQIIDNRAYIYVQIYSRTINSLSLNGPKYIQYVGPAYGKCCPPPNPPPRCYPDCAISL